MEAVNSNEKIQFNIKRFISPIKKEYKMSHTNNDSVTENRIGITNKALANLCHNCGICPFADKNPKNTGIKIGYSY